MTKTTKNNHIIEVKDNEMKRNSQSKAKLRYLPLFGLLLVALFGTFYFFNENVFVESDGMERSLLASRPIQPSARIGTIPAPGRIGTKPSARIGTKPAPGRIGTRPVPGKTSAESSSAARTGSTQPQSARGVARPGALARPATAHRAGATTGTAAHRPGGRPGGRPGTLRRTSAGAKPGAAPQGPTLAKSTLKTYASHADPRDIASQRERKEKQKRVISIFTELELETRGLTEEHLRRYDEALQSAGVYDAEATQELKETTVLECAKQMLEEIEQEVQDLTASKTSIIQMLQESHRDNIDRDRDNEIGKQYLQMKQEEHDMAIRHHSK